MRGSYIHVCRDTTEVERVRVYVLSKRQECADGF